ncbi:hypothetical protein ACIQHU_01405 [Streptomyces tendae]|uniref:hypothetical protein n=1 Tax=Streptomyces tendae TaxID=1932 RepID=UPI003811F7F0
MTPPRRDAGAPLPPVAPEVLAAAVESLTTRLRGRLDQAVESLATTPVDLAEDGTYGIRCGADAWVTLAPGPSGTITSPDQARCTCLLSPRCLHRTAALAASPLAAAIPSREPGPSPDRVPSVGSDTGRVPSAGLDTGRVPSAGLDTDPSPEGAPSAGPDPDRDPSPERAPSAAAAPSAGPAPSGGPAVPTGPAARAVRAVSSAGPASPAVPGRRPSAAQVRAAGGLWAAASAVLAAGAVAAGAVPQAELLRAAHTARLAGLHRAEGAALAVVRHLRATRDPQGAHRAHRADELVTSLRELLLVTHRLKAADPDPELIGGVPHNHRPDGPLRLYGVCREPVVGPAGAGGVLTHLVDDTGRWYTLRDVGPGGPARARRAGTAHVAVRSFLSDHERLSRGGLVVTGAVVAPDGRLLAERGVRATFAAGRPWADAVPATAAPDRLGSGHAPPLTGCDVRIVAADGDEVLVHVLTGDAPGPTVRLAPAHRHPALAHSANLRRLGACPGLEVRLLGRVDPRRVTTLRPVAVGPVPGATTTLRLPQEWRNRADLGYDLLADAHFPAGAHCPPPPSPPRTAAADARPADARPVDSPLRRIRDLVELAVTGGRRAAAEPARDGDRAGHVAALRRGGFATGADLFAALGAVAARRPRDAFGRPARDDQDQYAAQWLATAVYLTGTEAALARGLWHR